MQIEVVRDEAALAIAAADAICDFVRDKPDAVLGLPTGKTPIGAYAEIERRVWAGQADFRRTNAFALDEFAGVPWQTPGTNSMFFRQRLRFPMPMHLPAPDAPDLDAEIVDFASKARAAGGFDLCVLGIGTSGHIAFNEPGSPKDSCARIVDLTEETRAAHAEDFGAIDKVPHQGMTLGVADILESREILVLASGASKAEAVLRAIEGEVMARVPASWLQLHPSVRVMVDERAARDLSGQSERPQRPRWLDTLLSHVPFGQRMPVETLDRREKRSRNSLRGLYVIIDPDACRGRSPLEVARLALEGGSSIVQWRDKQRSMSEQIDDVDALAWLCRRYGVPFIVNDDLDLAAIFADGVHVGQDDTPVREVRRIAPPLIIGASTNNVEEAQRAESDGADYVAVGSIFPTSSKDVTRAASIERLREVKAAVHVPVVAIGGINASNIGSVIAAGADAVAVISSVCAADDPRAAAAELMASFTRAN